MTSPRPDPRLGTDLGPYRIEAVLGRGGMGVVYLAEHRELGRKVALKLLPDELATDADFRARFERESRLAAAIDHPNIIPLYEAGEVEGTLFLAMRYVDGVDLATRLRAGPMAPATAIEILTQVAGALDAAHARGLVHRDVKPGNVLLDTAAGGGREHAYLTDFGLTKQAGSESGLTRAGAFLGTPAYMAPEQIEGGDVDGRADQYSLACMAFECLTGHTPFRRDQEIAIAMAHLKDAPPSAVALRPELPAVVDAVLARALAKDPAARYASCDAFATDLRAALRGGAISARPIAAHRRRRPIMLVAGLGAALLLGLGALVLGSNPRASPSPSPTLLAAAPSASPTPTPTPDPSIFPNSREQALLSLLPADLASTCGRGARSDVDKAGFNGRIIVAVAGGKPIYENVRPSNASVSLSCVPTDGADAMFVQIVPEVGDSGAVGGEGAFHVVAIAQRYEMPPGDCAAGSMATTTWSIGGGSVANGVVACNPKASFDGHPWIYWSFGEGKILAFATRKDADYQALYAWWKQLTLFLK